MEEFVKQMKLKMKELNVKPTELANGAGVGRAYIHRVLDGQHTPTVEWAEKVADYLGFKITLVVSKGKR